MYKRAFPLKPPVGWTAVTFLWMPWPWKQLLPVLASRGAGSGEGKQ